MRLDQILSHSEACTLGILGLISLSGRLAEYIAVGWVKLTLAVRGRRRKNKSELLPRKK